MDKIKSFFGILFLTTCISSAFCQNAGVTTIGSTFACPGTSFVVLPLNITNSPPITAISMKIYYDAAVLSYRQNGIINKNPGLTPLFSSSQSSYGSTYKQLRISWYDVTAHIVDTNGTGKIADIVSPGNIKFPAYGFQVGSILSGNPCSKHCRKSLPGC